jgi:hypothetical protein
MHPTPEKKSQTRLIIASALFVLSVVTSFTLSYMAHRGEGYWVLTHPVAQGTALTTADLTEVNASIDRSISNYLSKSENPIGLIARRNLSAGIFVDRRDLTRDAQQLSVVDVSISVRAVDIPSNIGTGAMVSLYHLADSRNGEAVSEPVLITSRVFVREVARKSANFASDIALTVSLDERALPYLLSATTSGRVVVVSSHGS